MNRTLTCIVLIVSCLVFGTSHIEAQSHITKLYEQIAPAVVTIEQYDGYNRKKGTGSGFIIDSDGWIVTNHHVVEFAVAIDKNTEKFVKTGTVFVKLDNDRKVEAEVIYPDPIQDFALLKIPGSGFPCVPLGDSDTVQIGEEVIAIGNPLGHLERTLSEGIISQKRELSGGRKRLQTATPISHGSSGGPLINMDGQVIGITTSGIDAGQNLNFAVPINYVQTILPKIRAAADDNIACGGASPASATGSTSRPTSPVKIIYAYRPGGKGEFKQLADGDTMHSGDHYKILFSPMIDSYVYIFQGDSSGWLYLIYPLESFKGVAVNHVNPVRKGSTYFVPAKDKSFRLDEQRGPERFYVLMSSQREVQLEQYYQQVVAARQQNKSYDMQQAQEQILEIIQKKGPLEVVSDATGAESASWQEEGQAFSALWQYLEGACDKCAHILTFMHE